MSGQLFRIESDPRHLSWYLRPGRWPVPYCTKHHLEIEGGNYDWTIKCEDCPEPINLPSNLEDRAQYVNRKIEGKEISRLKPIRIDVDGSAVLAREHLDVSEDYFIDTKLSDTDGGLQVMILVGKKDASGNKVQLFVEPGTKRLNFDRNEKDQHPSGIFTVVQAKFKDSSQTIKSDA